MATMVDEKEHWHRRQISIMPFVLTTATGAAGVAGLSGAAGGVGAAMAYGFGMGVVGCPFIVLVGVVMATMVDEIIKEIKGTRQGGGAAAAEGAAEEDEEEAAAAEDGPADIHEAEVSAIPDTADDVAQTDGTAKARVWVYGNVHPTSVTVDTVGEFVEKSIHDRHIEVYVKMRSDMNARIAHLDQMLTEQHPAGLGQLVLHKNEEIDHLRHLVDDLRQAAGDPGQAARLLWAKDAKLRFHREAYLKLEAAWWAAHQADLEKERQLKAKTNAIADKNLQIRQLQQVEAQLRQQICAMEQHIAGLQQQIVAMQPAMKYWAQVQTAQQMLLTQQQQLVGQAVAALREWGPDEDMPQHPPPLPPSAPSAAPTTPLVQQSAADTTTSVGYISLQQQHQQQPSMSPSSVASHPHTQAGGQTRWGN
mmetsp:Transcript_22153/g.63185  ORF Transcript_22153/g.63185 Transcript_22153/m.63185 type:complete len:420 (-) Transcript_22153:439-1698(-)